ncbi:hypothetical protein [Stigmatella erecta]|uniref:hypothetical protein n=1 Tax=Stigmatella erecta TaxID=83460 RepID=UPI0011605A72|nr:hypothetical protein [Stigmatella erecta]
MLKFWPAVPSLGALTVQEPSAANDLSNWYYRDRWHLSEWSQPTAGALGLIDGLTAGIMPTMTATRAVWQTVPGMGTRTLWRFTVDLDGPGSWRFRLEAKEKSAADAAFLKLIEGKRTFQGGTDTGELSVDGSVLKTLPERPSMLLRTMALHYSISEAEHTVSGSMGEGLSIWTVDSIQRAKSGGDLKTFMGGWDGAWISLNARWTAAGAGRADMHTGKPDGRHRPTQAMCFVPDAKAVQIQPTWEETRNAWTDEPPFVWGDPATCVLTEALPFIPSPTIP